MDKLDKILRDMSEKIKAMPKAELDQLITELTEVSREAKERLAKDKHE